MSILDDVRRRVDVIAIVGPTASGKSALADELASRLASRVVSADAMQVYRHMDIGTAKTPVAERRVPLDCVDIVDPGEPFSVALYERHAHASIDSAIERGELPVVCGGTGLYVRAALEDMGFPAGDQVGNPVRERFEALAAELGPEGLHAYLAERDPDSAALIHPNNVRRVVRALELLEDGSSYAAEHATLHVRVDRHPTAHFGLMLDRARLYERIDGRVDAMIEGGLLEEVESLKKRGFADTLTARQAIGYKELLDVLDGSTPLSDAVEQIKRSTRRYAKRQMTWFRSDPRIRWIDSDGRSVKELADEVIRNICE